jgi:hypothetical protein
VQIDRRFVGFGLFLVTIGGVMLAVRQGVLDEETVGRTWTLWPLLLVGIGLSIALSGRPGAAIGGLVVAVTFGAMLGGVASTGIFPVGGFCRTDRGAATPFTQTSGNIQGRGTVTIAQSCGDLAIGTVAGSTWSVSGAARTGLPPVIDQTATSLAITARKGGPVDLDGGSSWDVVLPRDPLLDLDLALNGGESRVTLGGTQLGAVSIEANAGSIDLDLREVGSLGSVTLEVNLGSATVRLPNRSTQLDMSLNAGSAAICLPAGAGLRVKLDGVAASNDLARHGLVEANGAWETPGFGSAASRLEIEADANAGSLSLDPSRACGG